MLGALKRLAVGSGGAGAQARQPPADGSKVVIMEHPATEYKPNNPKWLIQGAGWTPDTIPAGYLSEPPPLAAFKEAVAAGELDGVQFGSEECRALFTLDPSFTYLNHGSYGAAYKLAQEVQAWYRQQLEREPVKFMETEGLAALVAAVAGVAGFVGADWRDVVPVTNATTGVNAVLHSLRLGRGDLVLMTNATYPAVRSTLAHTAAAAGAGLLDLQLDLDDLQDEEALLAVFRAGLQAGGRRLKLAVLDLIVSFPPVVMPVKRLCALFREAGVPVLVDGAHSVAALEGLVVPDLGCDFFVSTLHKHLCTPKGAAMLWTHPSKQAGVHPCVVSHGYELGYRAEFLWQGTSDFSAWLAAPACLAMQRALQPRRITSYSHGLAKQATAMLLQAWGTRLALGISKDGTTAGMVAIELPWPLAVPRGDGGGEAGGSGSSSAQATALGGGGAQQQQPGADQQQQQQQGDAASSSDGGSSSAAPPTADDAGALNLHLRQAHRIEVPVACISGTLFVRISAQIYNRLADYEALRDAVQALRR